MMRVYACTLLFYLYHNIAHVTGFTKAVLIGTRNEIHFIADYETYTLALPTNTKHIAIDSQVCFH